MLDKKQIESIEMMVTGDYTKQEIMERLGMHRTTFYKWIKNQEFLTELDKRLQEVKTQANKDFTSRLPKAIEEYWTICTKCTDVRTKEKALANWIERSLGRITNVNESEVTISTPDTGNILNDFKKFVKGIETEEENENTSNVS